MSYWTRGITCTDISRKVWWHEVSLFTVGVVSLFGAFFYLIWLTGVSFAEVLNRCSTALLALPVLADVSFSGAANNLYWPEMVCSDKLQAPSKMPALLNVEASGYSPRERCLELSMATAVGAGVIANYLNRLMTLG